MDVKSFRQRMVAGGIRVVLVGLFLGLGSVLGWKIRTANQLIKFAKPVVTKDADGLVNMSIVRVRDYYYDYPIVDADICFEDGRCIQNAITAIARYDDSDPETGGSLREFRQWFSPCSLKYEVSGAYKRWHRINFRLPKSMRFDDAEIVLRKTIGRHGDTVSKMRINLHASDTGSWAINSSLFAFEILDSTKFDPNDTRCTGFPAITSFK